METFNWKPWPTFNEKHQLAVKEVIESNQLFAADKVKDFEKAYSKFVSSKYAIGVGNATQGLQLSLHALGIGYGDEVIVTPYSWISSATCVLMQGAVPIFVDIESDSFGLSPKAIKKAITNRTKAVILVHMFGYPAKIEDILNICSDNSIHLIEDASHCHGAKFNKKSIGTFGDLGIFSLHQRKALPVGDGGIICTNNASIYQDIWKLRSFGHDKLSFNYRMTEFAAALGLVGLELLDHDNEKRIENHKLLASKLDKKFFKVLEPSEGSFAVFYSNLIEICLSYERQEELLKAASDINLPLKRTWQPLHQHPNFKRENMNNNYAPWDNHYIDFIEPADLKLPISEKYQKEKIFELDCHPLIEEEEVSKAALFLNDFVTKLS
ncbi:DegT/DnrJ/EryC1/StrS family aminotransferase [Prochlorococcus marinus XMU1412]|uniref:DegT/DnrJ/EryC1/StrS family aminotransferase n=1 Tax=Prochlorococcus marinus TaxID=1219 RepID=UPI001ADAB683|nr:DegT/DnrJ/EryC1/StrS family aminotransferase [Prochlorococcus marinus]MBO8240560.1 DegT/DnrJ/EryC1/StrS family aminotransferase [Prochlorococcus marinus XMU1412]MBW3071795.1 hypothetical protein [Prochlorococcus marinus str. MU1412]